MTERTIPAGAIPGRSTPEFTAESVPPALLRAHHTTVWAKLVVLDGMVTFVEEAPEWRVEVGASGSVVIVPNRKHHVEPSADARFFVQFYDLPT